jgi:hypothetical protein
MTCENTQAHQLIADVSPKSDGVVLGSSYYKVVSSRVNTQYNVAVCIHKGLLDQASLQIYHLEEFIVRTDHCLCGLSVHSLTFEEPDINDLIQVEALLTSLLKFETALFRSYQFVLGKLLICVEYPHLVRL